MSLRTLGPQPSASAIPPHPRVGNSIDEAGAIVKTFLPGANASDPQRCRRGFASVNDDANPDVGCVGGRSYRSPIGKLLLHGVRGYWAQPTPENPSYMVRCLAADQSAAKCALRGISSSAALPRQHPLPVRVHGCRRAANHAPGAPARLSRGHGSTSDTPRRPPVSSPSQAPTSTGPSRS